MNSPLLALLLLAACTVPRLHAEGVTLPENDPYNQGAMGAGGADPEREAAAKEPDLPGKIRGVDRFDLKEVRQRLAASLAALPEGPAGRGSPWLPKFKAVEAGLDKVLASRTQEDCLALIPLVAAVLPAWADHNSAFNEAARHMRDSGTALVHTAAWYVEEKKGKVSKVNLQRLVMLFSRGCDGGECDWEDGPMPIDRAGVMILNPVAVMEQLKTLPPEETGLFYGNWDLKFAFEGYEEAGHGMPLLKARYAANREQIRAKWQELADWVAKHPEKEPGE